MKPLNQKFLHGKHIIDAAIKTLFMALVGNATQKSAFASVGMRGRSEPLWLRLSLIHHCTTIRSSTICCCIRIIALVHRIHSIAAAVASIWEVVAIVVCLRRREIATGRAMHALCLHWDYTHHPTPAAPHSPLALHFH